MKILDRINELANKEKVQPLTVAEKQEQHALRQDYLSMIRGQVLTTFSTIKVVDPIGQDVTPDKVYDLRQQCRTMVHITLHLCMGFLFILLRISF